MTEKENVRGGMAEAFDVCHLGALLGSFAVVVHKKKLEVLRLRSG
jgi:hypothetical protein